MILIKRWAKRWRLILLDLFTFIGSAWLLVEVASYFSNGAVDHNFRNISVFIIILVISLILSIAKNKPKNKFGYHLRNKDNYIEVNVGDAFKNKGALVVPVNDQLDMSLGGNVQKAKSIQNQVIQRYYDGKVEHIKTDISTFIPVGTKHEIGKTIEVEQRGKKFYWLVNSTKKNNNRVKSEIDDFIQALNGLWAYIALESGRDSAVTIPLINTQHGRDSYLTRTGSIKEIITSYVESSKSLNICEKLIISIDPGDLEKGGIDLDELNDYLKFSSKHYRQLTLQQKSKDPDKGTKVIRIEN